MICYNYTCFFCIVNTFFIILGEKFSDEEVRNHLFREIANKKNGKYAVLCGFRKNQDERIEVDWSILNQKSAVRRDVSLSEVQKSRTVEKRLKKRRNFLIGIRRNYSTIKMVLFCCYLTTNSLKLKTKKYQNHS